MSKFEESNFYKALQDFFINADKKTFLQFLAEFYNRTEGIIDKNNIQDDLLKELRELYLEFNEKGIDENIVREKVNYFVENNVKIKDIISKLDNIDKYNNTINLEKLGIISENVVYNDETNKYVMTDITDIINNAINKKCDILIFPSGNFCIEGPVIINRPLSIIGNNTNIYTSPTATSKRVFQFKNSNSSIQGFNFFSKNKYLTSLNDPDRTAFSSNVCGIDVIGENQKNINISNCYFEGMGLGVSVQYTSNVIIDNCTAIECFFPVYTGLYSKNITIKNCSLTCQVETDLYGHVLYFADTSSNILVDNCILKSLGKNTNNIIKCGSNTGNSSNVNIRNTSIECSVLSTLFYVHQNGDLTLYNCKINANSLSGYTRLLQIGNNSSFKAYNCEFVLDSFERYTQGFDLTNTHILFESSKIIIKNTYQTYCNMPFVSGSETFNFKNCTIDLNIDRGFNLLSPEHRSLVLENCNININNKLITCGVYSSSDVNYTKTSSPILKMFNTNIFNNSTNEMGSSAFFMNIVKDSTTTPTCLLTNVTLYKCTGTSGGNNGKLFMTNAETQYIKNNVIDIKP